MTVVHTITFCRSDFSSLKPVVRALTKSEDVSSKLVVTGSHLEKQYGMTVKEIEEENLSIDYRLPCWGNPETEREICAAVGRATAVLGEHFSKTRPDLILVNGDRIELMSVVIASLTHKIPIAHISGGDLTEGSIDNQVRFAVSKASHLHFVCMEEHRERLLQIGEDPSHVLVTGDPALDEMLHIEKSSKEDLCKELGLHPALPIFVITIHPDSIDTSQNVEQEVEAVLDALTVFRASLIFTAPNADAGREKIRSRLKRYASSHSEAIYIESFGQRRFYSLLQHAAVMIGNSSSGIWESPSFKLPVVNIGTRQHGRVRCGNVLDVPFQKEAIEEAIHRALEPSFQESMQSITNLYGDGTAAEKIREILENLSAPQSLFEKEFHQWPPR